MVKAAVRELYFYLKLQLNGSVITLPAGTTNITINVHGGDGGNGGNGRDGASGGSDTRGESSPPDGTRAVNQ